MDDLHLVLMRLSESSATEASYLVRTGLCDQRGSRNLSQEVILGSLVPKYPMYTWGALDLREKNVMAWPGGGRPLMQPLPVVPIFIRCYWYVLPFSGTPFLELLLFWVLKIHN